MTHPIPGADSERADFEALFVTILDVPGNPRLFERVSDDRRYCSMEVEYAWLTYRAAAKVGANVAAPVTEERIHTWINGIGGGIWKDGALTLRRDELVAAIRGIVNLAAGAPAETPKPVAVELIGVAEQIDQGAGFWHSCSGCHDTEDGHPTGNYSYSNEMRCALGSGCAECGGMGAMWDNNDYSEEAWNAAQTVPAPIAPKRDLEGLMRNISNAKYIKAYFDSVWALVDEGDALLAAPIAGDVEKDAAMQLALDALEVATTPLPEDRQKVLRAQAAIRVAMLANSSSGEAG